MFEAATQDGENFYRLQTPVSGPGVCTCKSSSTADAGPFRRTLERSGSATTSTSSIIEPRSPSSAFTSNSAISSAQSSLLLSPPYAPGPDSQAGDGKNIVVHDGGGVRGIFAVLFWQELQIRMPPGIDVRELIDLMGGTSCGGVSAMMIGRLGLPLDQCADILKTHPRKMFGSRGLRSLRWLLTDAQYSTDRQRRLYASVVARATGDPAAHLSDGAGAHTGAVPVFVVAVDTEDIGRPAVFASYDAPAGVSIVDAAQATSAAPTFFRPARIGARAYVDGAVGFNNPAELALRELRRVHGARAYVATLVSLGTGVRARPHRMRHRSSVWAMLRAFARISTNAEAVHERMEERFLQTGGYYRFNPPGLAEVALDDWTAVDRIVECSTNYLKLPETQARMDEVAQRLLASQRPP